MANIEALLFEKFESFENRQIPFNFQREFFNPQGEANRPPSDVPPNATQRQHIFKRTLMEWVRSEMPTQLEYLRSTIGSASLPSGPPSVESQQAVNYGAVPPDLQRRPEYWPNDVVDRNWVEIFRRQMFLRPHASFLRLNQAMAGSTGNLTLVVASTETGYPGPPFYSSIPFTPVGLGPVFYGAKENNNLYDGVDLRTASVPVDHALSPIGLANGIIESSELLYAILYNSFDAEGARGTHFLHQTDLGDVDKDGIPEIVDGDGFPLIFSITVQNVGQNGVAMDRNSDGSFDFRDQLLDPRYPAEPQDYLFHVGSVGMAQYPPHLQHLRYANFLSFDR